jgi:hypothetical protein
MPAWQTDGNPDVHIGANSFLGTLADDPLRIRTRSNVNNADAMIITPAPDATTTGNVGIGTTAPQAKLDVRGAIRAGNSDIYFTRTDHNHTGIGNNADFAAIENAANYGALMILGRTVSTNPLRRVVKLWDFLEVNGDVTVTGDITLPGADCAEYFSVPESAQIDPGMALVVDQEDALLPCEKPYDRRVVGVVSGAGDLKPGILLDEKNSRHGRQPLSVVGKAYCKVDAQYAPIEVGDLLTTSPTLGHAMKAVDPSKAFGAVIGKALKPLREGTGLIPLIVALQ